MLKRSYIVVLVIFAVLAIDQALKFYIKLNFEYNQEELLLGQKWARLHFVENEGMAFGFTFGWEYGKLALSLFRILMVGALIWYIRMLLHSRASLGLICSIGLITAGAIGNIIDSAFYGIWFTESEYHGGLAQWASTENPGYGTFLHGKVVDMLYFPMKWIHIPDWSPIWSGEDVLFFSPIFNIADAAITTGVVSVLLFQRSFFQHETTTPAPAVESGAEENDVVAANETPNDDQPSTDDNNTETRA